MVTPPVLMPPLFTARIAAKVSSTATTMVAAMEVASCGKVSCQLRFVKRNHQPAPAGTAPALRLPNSASITLLMPSHIARSFGTASYSPRCSRQWATIAFRSSRASAQGAQALRCASTSAQSRGVSDPSIRSLRRFWYFSQFIVLTSDASHHGKSLGRHHRGDAKSNKGETAFEGGAQAFLPAGREHSARSSLPYVNLARLADFPRKNRPRLWLLVRLFLLPE